MSNIHNRKTKYPSWMVWFVCLGLFAKGYGQYTFQWSNVLGANTSATAISKSGTTAAWDAGAFSNNVITATTSGIVDFKVADVSKTFALGFSTNDVDKNFTSIEYCLHLENRAVKLYKSGVLQTSGITAANNDWFRIEKVLSTNTIKFYKKLASATVPNPNTFVQIGSITMNPVDRALKLDVSLYNGSAGFSNLTANFNVPVTVAGTVTDAYCTNLTTKGSINITPSNGISPYTYNWGSGITTQNRSNLNIGTYNVTVTDVGNIYKA
jgi:hypothetical protein